MHTEYRLVHTSTALHYATRVRACLLAAGLVGIDQRSLHQKSRTPSYKIKHLLFLLESWKQRRWVDKYTNPTNRDQTIYRATQLLHDEWFIVLGVVDEALVGPPLVPSHAPSETSDPEPTSPVEPTAS